MDDASGLILNRDATLRYLLIALAANVILWLSMLYTVFAIDKYYKHRAFFDTMTWVIFLILFFMFGFLILTPYPPFWKRKRMEIGEKGPCKSLTIDSLQCKDTHSILAPRYNRIVNMLNAITCFTLVETYLYANAIPIHKTPKWSSGVTYANDIQFPGILLCWITGFNTTGIELSDISCSRVFPDSEMACNDYVKEADPIYFADDSGGPCWVFNGSAAPASFSPSSSIDEIELTYWVTCQHTSESHQF
jgi:hypothetical protein